ncbi:MAG: hypothetical protein AABW91_04515 [Nanoarchaeota archaeon]
MEYSYYDYFSFYTKVKIPPTTFERKALVEKIKGKDLVLQDFDDKNISFRTGIDVGNVFENGFLLFIPTQKSFTYIPYGNMDSMELMIGPWFEPLKV